MTEVVTQALDQDSIELEARRQVEDMGALAALEDDIQDPTDKAVLKSWDSELRDERKSTLANLGHSAVKVEVVDLSGSAIPIDVVHQELAAGRSLYDGHPGGYKA